MKRQKARFPGSFPRGRAPDNLMPSAWKRSDAARRTPLALRRRQMPYKALQRAGQLAPRRRVVRRTRRNALRRKGKPMAHASHIHTRKGVALAMALLLGGIGGARAAEPTANAIEYYNASLNHYFMTANPVETTILDANVMFPGWQRTGVEFAAYATAGDNPAALPVCRFFGTPGVGPNSHFYTADANECALTRQNPDWIFEAIAFWIPVPAVSGTGSCPAGSQPVYRSFYPGGSKS
jgi:hypothetical protein